MTSHVHDVDDRDDGMVSLSLLEWLTPPQGITSKAMRTLIYEGNVAIFFSFDLFSTLLTSVNLKD